MTEKIQKISADVFEKYVRENAPSSYESMDWHGMDIKIKKRLSLEEMIEFISGVVNSCFDIDNGVYLPELKAFASDLSTVKMYTNIDLPQDDNTKYDLIYTSGIVEKILKHIDMAQYSCMMNAIDDKINSILAANEKQFEQRVAQIESLMGSLDATNLIELIQQIADSGAKALSAANIIDAYKSSHQDGQNASDGDVK